MYSSESSKKKRSANFTNNDKALLINIVSKYKSIIENKKTDAVTNNEKLEAWKKIVQEYNSSGPSCPRDLECLKRCYENKKKILRKTVAAQRRELYKTGGGLPDINKKEPIDDLLLSVVNTKTVKGLENPFDGDNLKQAQKSINNFNTSTEEFEDIDIEGTRDIFLESTEENFEIFGENDVENILSNAGKETKPNKQGGDEDRKRKKITLVENKASSPSTSKQSKIWNHYKVKDLRSDPNPALNPESMTTNSNNATSRRRPRTIVRPLAGSHLSEKYDKLLEERLEVARYQKQQLQNQIKAELKEHELRVQLLTLQVQREQEANSNNY